MSDIFILYHDKIRTMHYNFIRQKVFFEIKSTVWNIAVQNLWITNEYTSTLLSSLLITEPYSVKG